MKQEIKFKFWLCHTKKMTYEHSLIDIAHLHWDFTEDIIPLQLSPFKDKNEKEIYDGDIIGDWTEVDGKMIQSAMQVYFDEMLGQWMLDCSIKNDKSISYSLFQELKDFKYEILGNIYENPELFEAAN
jgi:uncharacterized phage protein (TIGR01671 family)